MSVLWLQRPFSGGSRELGRWVCYFAAVTELIIEGSRLYGFSETILSPSQESFSREEEDLEPGSCIHGNAPPTGRGRDSVPPRAQQSALFTCWHLQASPPQSNFFFLPTHLFCRNKNTVLFCFFPLLPSFGLFSSSFIEKTEHASLYKFKG